MTQLLLSTQPVTDSLEENSPVDYEDPWGRFYPMNMHLADGNYINLIQPSFTVGRYSGCDYTLTQDEIGEKIYGCVSNYQFRVDRKEENGLWVTLITDLSTNGTYINGTIIGKNNKSVLCNNDCIAIAKNTNTVFLFIDLTEKPYGYPDEILKNYAILNVLGRGGFGEVRLVMRKQSTEKFAMKIINIQPKEKQVIDNFNEVKILRALSHENVVKLHNVILAENDMYLLLECVSGGDLSSYLLEKKKLTEDVTKFIFYQIARGVEYLHNEKVLHRDLKPGNILLTSKCEYPRIKITDFGLSKILENRIAAVHTRCGTLNYAAPELQFPHISDTYDFRADVWSLGVILFQCLSGTLPFSRTRKDLTIENQVKLANYKFEKHLWENISFRPKWLIKHCLVRSPKGRLVITNLTGDEWFTKDPVFLNRVGRLKVNKENACDIPVKRRRV